MEERNEMKRLSTRALCESRVFLLFAILDFMTEISGDLTQSFPKYLRDQAVAEINTRGLTREELADKLDLFPSGVDRIMSQKEWPASLGCRVLEALNMTVTIRAADRPDV